MTLHSGIDTVSFVSGGVYSKTYGSTDTKNIASLFAARGMLELAPGGGVARRSGKIAWLLYYLRSPQRHRRRRRDAK